MNAINKQKAYLFDFDGTLVDSMPTFISVMLKILDEQGIKYQNDIVKTITPLGYLGTAEYFRTLGVALPAAELVATMNEYAEYEYVHKIQAKETVLETLIKLKERGHSLNVLTASPHGMLDPCLKRIGAWDLFDNVWSCDDFRTTKTDPAIYQSAANKIGKDVSDVIFVDDNINAVKTAKAAGMTAYGIYDTSSDGCAEEMTAVADRYIEKFSALLDE